MPDLHSDAGQMLDDPGPCTSAQRGALGAIVAAAEDGSSFAALTGEAATGKTAVLDMAQALLDHPPIQVIRVRAGGQALTSKRLIVAIAGSAAEGDDEAAIERALDRLLLPAPPRRRTILMVDDAHALERDALAYLSLASGMFGDDIAPLQIVFAGRPSFWSLLESDPMGRLSQRIRYRAVLDAPMLDVPVLDAPAQVASSAVAVLPGRAALRELMVLRPARRRTVRYALGSGVAASLLVASMVPMGRDAAPPRRAQAGAPAAPRLAAAPRPAVAASAAPKPAAPPRPAAAITPMVVPAVARMPARPAAPASRAMPVLAASVPNAAVLKVKTDAAAAARPRAAPTQLAHPAVQVAAARVPARPLAPQPVARPPVAPAVAPAPVAPTLGPDSGLLAAAGLVTAQGRPPRALLDLVFALPPAAAAAPVAVANAAPPRPPGSPPPTRPAAIVPAMARPAPVLALAPAPAAVATLPAPIVAALLSRGDDMLRLGDIGAARLLYERAAASGSSAAALAMGRTHDPRVLTQIGAEGIAPDPATAAAWYRRAAALGSREAGGLLAGLETTTAQ